MLLTGGSQNSAWAQARGQPSERARNCMAALKQECRPAGCWGLTAMFGPAGMAGRVPNARPATRKSACERC
eukprot:15439713-Alexandrium_andersonii.AAC.1